MPDKPNKPLIPGFWTQIVWITRGLLFAGRMTGRGFGAAFRTMRDATHENVSARSIEIVHDIMYAGIKHMPGSPRPSVRTTALTPDELVAFTIAANKLVDLEALPTEAATFARNYNISLKQKR